uniref:Phosphoribosylformylglycinamidine synthase n=1 Tax=Candidatus Kentrum eta TaxID=2126337 RepID=A0A450UVC9_9GAMM|nr:MAG: phosphoribosylformylglycinamidine synthase [Candidatus Kentron sp. H]VFJ97096.1 MAG: phosphoribosylformylglycinamidine synthase [Candidatus Kentron sp. H]VFK02717.1 MAG: phosphoribosylformylglycinamidine synthase [Candidatus Kentron sp. H]
MTMKSLRLPGPPALSSFRLRKLLATIREAVPQVSSLRARFVHFARLADPDRPLTEEERARLDAILDYGGTGDDGGCAPGGLSPSTPGRLILVAPRPGTVSPWSSKASDIAHHCGLGCIARLERGIAFSIVFSDAAHGAGLPAPDALATVAVLLHDPMTQAVFYDFEAIEGLFEHAAPAPLGRVALSGDPDRRRAELEAANRDLGLALSDEEIGYMGEGFAGLGRDPSDVELMMFAQVNSEHCRHKVFNADWVIDGAPQEDTLFGMIRRTYADARDSRHILSAYADNSAVMKGEAHAEPRLFYPDPASRRYADMPGEASILMKVETHNHPTAISPYPGAATGSGGEIRDEAATGRGARAKAGLTGFSVSNLRIPGFEQPWEKDFGRPARIASALRIMQEAPIGAAGFNNEFGRPALLGYFRTFEALVTDGADGQAIRGYHKPIMLAGGLGNIRAEQVAKQALPAGAPIVVLGGPAMLIGLGGGAASSLASGTTREDLDFASVQRDNPEMQRRCQEVIDRCWQMGDGNPILSLHDVGAGGLSNALPELVHGGGKGGRFELRAIPSDDPGMSPLALWCNESQERYVLAIAPERLDRFLDLCRRERCPRAVVGETTEGLNLTLTDDPVSHAMDTPLDNLPIHIPLDFLFGNPPRMVRDVTRIPRRECRHLVDASTLHTSHFTLPDAVHRVLRLPTVARKSFLITIGDRSVTGLVARDQMVGPWQVPVADCAVTASGFNGYTGEAMAMGERAPAALINAPAAGRLAVAEAITNIAGASIRALDRVVLSANWMAACGHPGEDARLFDTVRAVTELCLALGIVIPVGKDSLSMKTVWTEAGQSGSEPREVTAPLSLIVSAFAPVLDIRKTLTPQLRTEGETDLILIDLGRGKNRLGGSALAQVFEASGEGEPADLDRPEDLKAFFDAIGHLNRAGYLLAYHDRSDGGLLATVCEMAFAGHTGVTVALDGLGNDPLAILFAEEPGAVVQVRRGDRAAVLGVLASHGKPAGGGLAGHIHVIGQPNRDDRIRFRLAGEVLFEESRIALQRAWSETGYRMQSLRDNPDCAEQEYQRILDADDPGLTVHLGFGLSGDERHVLCRMGKVATVGERSRTKRRAHHQREMGTASHAFAHPTDEDNRAPLPGGVRPRIAILREVGVNGHVEMAAAFHRAGFDCSDVHMSEIMEGGATLADYHGLAACGGFSYGDVLGAGGGWANAILHNPRARDVFAAFFARPETFTLGVCNGCQMLSRLTALIPGTDHWPRFARNRSEQFEARLVLCQVLPSPSLFLTGMAGSRLPIVVAHGEGRARFPTPEEKGGPEETLKEQTWKACLRYVDNRGAPTERYPANPNGSPAGVTGFTSLDGRVTIMMPHPERLFRGCQYSWHPDDWGEAGPWLRLFENARTWAAGNGGG